MSRVPSADELSAAEGMMLPEYRAVSGWAIGGLLLGLAAVLAFIHPVLWVVPVAGAVTCLLALRQISAQASALVGRRAALVGLAICLIVGISCPVQFFLVRYQLRAAAIRAARDWFTAVRYDRPFVAHQLSLQPEARWTLDDVALVSRYLGEGGGLKAYVSDPLVRLLLVLGKQCRVRHYDHVGVISDSSSDNVMDVYAVTVEHNGRRTTFFVRVAAVRTFNLAANEWQWRISRTEFVRAPPGQLGFEFTRM